MYYLQYQSSKEFHIIHSSCNIIHINKKTQQHVNPEVGHVKETWSNFSLSNARLTNSKESGIFNCSPASSI